ncbi:MAG: PKD repeat protein [Flavobacteriales bacterium]|jgi:PKD repeat protein
MKQTLILLIILIGFNSFSQDLTITEISYNGPEAGTDSTEYVELYNNSSTTIDLTGYSFSSGVTHTFYSGETIAPSTYYVVAVDSLAVFNTFGFLPDAEFSGGLSNGGEPVVLINSTGVTQDSVWYDDTSPWPTGADGNGPSLVFCNLSLDNADGTNWILSTTNAGIVVNGNTVFGSPGADDAACSGSATLDTIATISTADMTVFENVGTVDVTVTLNQPATNNKTVDLLLNIGNAAIANGYTTQTITFTGGSTSETVTITITTGQLASASETLEFGLNNIGIGLEYGVDTLFNLTVNEMPVSTTPCSDLFFSEYIEGSSNNKALEIYNPTTGIIDLSNYAIRRYNNGAATPSSTFYLSGNLTPGNVYVVANSQADPGILAVADITSGIASFNGDDAVELYDTTNMAAIDIIGEIGVDPGASWPVGTGATANNSLIRMATVDAGALVWAGLGDTQWDVMPTDDFTDLGTHTNTSCTAPIPLTAYPIIGDTSVCIGDTIVFDHTSFGGSTPYTVGWTINGTNYVQDSVWYIVTASGAISAQLAVVDAALASDNVTTAFTIANAPVAGFILSANTICEGDIATISSTATGGNISYTYSDFASAGTFNVSSSTGDGDYTNTSGIYDLQQTVIDSNGCSSSIIESLTILINEDASFTALADICELDTVLLSHTNPTGVWSGTGVVDQGSGQGYFTESAGTFGITYTIAGTCGDAYTDSVDVFDLPVAGFTNSGSPVVNFTNTSTGGASYTWDFGNGNTSSAQDPTNTYTANGIYPVTLTVTSANGCINSIIIDVTIQGLSITENQVSFKMYPNPATDIVTIKTIRNSSKIEVINLIGETVYTAKSNGNTTINVSEISKGAYFIRVTEGTASSTQKLIIR